MAAKCPVWEHQWKITVANIADTKKKLSPNSATVPSQSGQPFVQAQVISNNQTIPNSEMVLGVNKKNKMIVLLFCIFLGCLVIQVLCR